VTVDQKRYVAEVTRAVRRHGADWAPIAELVIQAGQDPAAAAVLNDWCLERGRVGGSAWLVWELHGPTKYQRQVTQFVIGRETVSANYPETPERPPDFSSAFREAQRQLQIHKHARWVRVVTPSAMQAPQGTEALIDRSYTQRGDALRTRCKMPDCLQESLGARSKRPPGLTNETLPLAGQ
jgi:hypothetical protein